VKYVIVEVCICWYY